MKLVRYEKAGQIGIGALDASGENVVDITAANGGSTSMSAFLAKGAAGLQAAQAALAEGATRYSLNSVRLLAPVGDPGKIMCIGQNYRDHCEEQNQPIPERAILFAKFATALNDPHGIIRLLRISPQIDYEAELAVIIGRRALYVPKEKALDYVAGYALHNDYSERNFQIERGGQWVKGKSADTFAPLGPFLATPDEVPNVGNSPMWLKVNGTMRQNGSTSNMIFDVATLVSYVTQFMTLLPGDVISTGTPAGVGLGMNPPLYLKAGDVVELGIDGLGESRQQVIAYDGRAY